MLKPKSAVAAVMVGLVIPAGAIPNAAPMAKRRENDGIPTVPDFFQEDGEEMQAEYLQGRFIVGDDYVGAMDPRDIYFVSYRGQIVCHPQERVCGVDGQPLKTSAKKGELVKIKVSRSVRDGNGKCYNVDETYDATVFAVKRMTPIFEKETRFGPAVDEHFKHIKTRDEI